MKRKKTKPKPRSTEPTCTITITNWEGRQMRLRGKPVSIVTRNHVEDVTSWSDPYAVRAIAGPSEVVVVFERGSLKCRTSA